MSVFFEAAMILKDYPNIYFIVLGSGDLEGFYRSFCASLPNVIFLGQQPRAYVQPILKLSSVLYFSAHSTPLLNYGQSLNKLVDYMFSAKPILGSFSGYLTMINESCCGECVAAGDAKLLPNYFLKWSHYSPDYLSNVGSRRGIGFKRIDNTMTCLIFI